VPDGRLRTASALALATASRIAGIMARSLMRSEDFSGHLLRASTIGDGGAFAVHLHPERLA
jgi:hypothetical protein